MNIILRRQLIHRLSFGFAKWSKPKPIPSKFKEQRSAKALGDDKAAKLSKSQLENEAKIKVVEDERIETITREKMALIQRHDPSLQLRIPNSELHRLKNYQLMKLKGILPMKSKPAADEKEKDETPYHTPAQLYRHHKRKGRRVAVRLRYNNYQKEVNKPHEQEVKPIKPTDKSRRVGVVGVKLGMTSLWDDWGRMVGVTAIQLDRVQIVQIKEPQAADGLYHVQIGSGERNIKRLNKPDIGHFMKAGVPPKRYLSEFKVSKDCLLPVGYMIGARHYTPGMLVDVIGKTVGHGFSGTIKKFGFKRQPASHGNSLTTRVLGSTGCRQDPGRVFKMKKMYGRKGQDITIQESLRVFKIDCDRNIVYLYGSVPGKAGTMIRLRDNTRYHRHQKNMEICHYPTFIEQPGKKYARQFRMFVGARDPDEIDYNDNAYILDDKEEDPTLNAPTGAAAAQMNLPED